MGYRTPAERQLDAFERALRIWEHEHPVPAGPTAPLPTIAISRQAGSDASAIALAVGDTLGWPVYDRQLLDKIAEEMGTRREFIEAIDEHHSGWWAELIEPLFARPGLTEIAYVRRLRPVMLSLAARGECVIVGRGAAQILPAATTLRVRLVGPLEERIAGVQKRFGVPAEEARRRVLETDYHRSRFVRDYFHKNPDDPALYDLTLNVCRISAADCARIIAGTLEALRVAGVFAPAGGPQAVSHA